jgi:predicted nucleotidyltransferase
LIPLAQKHSQDEVVALYLFGSYARQEATASSDVDLLLDGSLAGLSFFSFQNECEKTLHKKVDLIRLDELKGKTAFFSSIIKERITVYESSQK